MGLIRVLILVVVIRPLASGLAPRLKVAQLFFLDIFPRAFGMFLGAAHTRGQVFQAVHMQPPATVTRRKYSFSSAEIFHARHHFHLEGSAVIPFMVVDGSWLGK
jgi:hypothetical protein